MDARQVGTKSGSKLATEGPLAATTRLTVYSLLILPKALPKHTTLSISCVDRSEKKSVLFHLGEYMNN